MITKAKALYHKLQYIFYAINSSCIDSAFEQLQSTDSIKVVVENLFMIELTSNEQTYETSLH